jgi:hypothetical protein
LQSYEITSSEYIFPEFFSLPKCHLDNFGS